MSYFNGLKLTKKGEQLQAKVNGNLSKTLTFTKAKLGSGKISSENEIRFLTGLKEEWGEASISSCTIQNETKVAIELQFSNANLTQDKIFRELALYAKTDDEAEVLFAYANAGEKYDYIPLVKDSPHTFIITIHFTISSSAKVNASIDLNSYVSLKTFNEMMKTKVSKTGDSMTGTLAMKQGAVIVGAYNYGYMLAKEDESAVYLAYYGANKKINIGYGNDIPVNFYNDKVTIKNFTVWHAGNFNPSDYQLKINTATGFNLDKSDSISLIDSDTLATSKAVADLNKEKFDKSGGMVNGNVVLDDGKVFVGAYNYGYMLRGKDGVDKYFAYLEENGTIRIGHSGSPINFAYNNVTIANNSIWHTGNFNPSEKLDLTGGTMTGDLINTTNIRGRQIIVGKSLFFRDYYESGKQAQIWFCGNDNGIYKKETLYISETSGVVLKGNNKVLTQKNSGLIKETLFEGRLSRTSAKLRKSINEFDIIVVQSGDEYLNTNINAGNSRGDMNSSWYFPEDLIGKRIQVIHYDTNGTNSTSKYEVDGVYYNFENENTVSFAYQYEDKKGYDSVSGYNDCKIIGLKYSFGGR